MRRTAPRLFAKEGERVLQVQRVQRGVAYFFILSGEKRRMLKNGLSEI